jgi:hypothetical protein
MIDRGDFELWFLTGSQSLYGEDTLRQVEEQSTRIVRELDGSSTIPLSVISKPVLTTPDATEPLRHLLHLFPCLAGDRHRGGRVVEHSRHRRLVDAGGAGNVLHGHGAGPACPGGSLLSPPS